MYNKKTAAAVLRVSLSAGSLWGCGNEQADSRETDKTVSDTAAGGRGGMMGETGSTEGVDRDLELTGSEVDTGILPNGPRWHLCGGCGE
ncbi:MAG: hypothetical protein ACLRMZ_02200 [Blautia marasmi]